MSNEWLENSSDTGDSSYSPDKFYTVSRNKKGFGTTIRVTVPPEVMAHIGEVIARRVIPEFKTPGDVFRNAIVHSLHNLSQFIDDPQLSAESIKIRDRMIAESVLDNLIATAAFDKRMSDNGIELLRNAHDGNRQETVEKIQQILPEISDPRLRDALSRYL